MSVARADVLPDGPQPPPPTCPDTSEVPDGMSIVIVVLQNLLVGFPL